MDSVSSALNSISTTFSSPISGSTSGAGPSTVASVSTKSSSAPSPLEVASRPANPADPGYITVEPDGRDDVTFCDRLRQAIEGFFKTFKENADTQEIGRAHV